MRIAVLTFAMYFVHHLAWYTYDHVLYDLGITNPKDLAELVGDAGLPVAAALIVAAGWLQHFLD